MLALGLCVLYVGITGIVKGMDSVMLVLSVAIGVIIGEAIDFDAAFNKLGMYVERKLPSESGSVAGTPKPKPEAAERSTKASRQRILAETFKGGRWPG